MIGGFEQGKKKKKKGTVAWDSGGFTVPFLRRVLILLLLFFCLNNYDWYTYLGYALGVYGIDDMKKGVTSSPAQQHSFIYSFRCLRECEMKDARLLSLLRKDGLFLHLIPFKFAFTFLYPPTHTIQVQLLLPPPPSLLSTS